MAQEQVQLEFREELQMIQQMQQMASKIRSNAQNPQACKQQ